MQAVKRAGRREARWPGQLGGGGEGEVERSRTWGGGRGWAKRACQTLSSCDCQLVCSCSGAVVGSRWDGVRTDEGSGGGGSCDGKERALVSTMSCSVAG